MMNGCEKFEDDLLKYYFGEEDEKPKASEYIKMQTHIRSCPSCSIKSEKYKGIQAALNGIIKQKATATFFDTLADKLPKPSPVSTFIKKTHKQVTSIPKFVWIGALVLVALIGFGYLYSILFATYNLPIIYYKGAVDLKRGGDTAGWQKLQKCIPLCNGDKLSTDDASTVIFAVTDDTTVRTSESTKVNVFYIQKSGKDGYICKLALVEGLIWVSQKGQIDFEKQKLQIETENAIIESLGADFDLSYSDNNRTLLRVFRGKVKFYHKHFPDEKSIISDGKSSITSADQPPTSPADMDVNNLGGWESWNRDMALPPNLREVRPETLADKLGVPQTWIQLQATPPPAVEATPTPTPMGGYY